MTYLHQICLYYSKMQDEISIDLLRLNYHCYTSVRVYPYCLYFRTLQVVDQLMKYFYYVAKSKLGVVLDLPFLVQATDLGEVSLKSCLIDESYWALNFILMQPSLVRFIFVWLQHFFTDCLGISKCFLICFLHLTLNYYALTSLFE